MLCEITGIEPTYRTMNPIKQVLRSSQTGALCLKHKKINEEIFLTYAIASKIAISTISMTSIIENVLNVFFISPPFFYLFFSRSTINCSGSALAYALPTTASLSPRHRLLPPSMAACSYLQSQSPSIQLSLRDNKHLSL